MSSENPTANEDLKQQADSAPNMTPSPLNGVVPPVDTRWKPGQSGNPPGRKSAAATLREWINIMENWPVGRIRAVLTSDTAPMAKRAAARVWMDAITEERTKGGIPIAGPEVDRIMDRTEGKPRQAVEHSGEVTTHVKRIILDRDGGE